MRLNRYLAAAGLGSRRSCEELIRAGRIEVNGETALFPGPEIEPQHDEVRFDGERLRVAKKNLYYAFHKPAGIVTTLHDERGRRCLAEYLGRLRGRVVPVGRLDRATEGLLLLTNNGELVHHLLHPRYKQERIYMAWVRPVPDLLTIRKIEAGGVALGNEEFSGPAKMRVLGRQKDVGRVRLTLWEGKYREVRRLFRATGRQVLVLRRMSFAGIRLADLPVGTHRALHPDEVELLRHRTGLDL